MPELPEVETVRRALAPHTVGRTIRRLLLRRSDLRFPIPPELPERLQGQAILALDRRAKYLLLETAAGQALIHLGMSGQFHILKPPVAPPTTHDHWDAVLDDHTVLRYRDPRRFGALLYAEPGVTHPMLAGLGPEPWDPHFSGVYLRQLFNGRRAPIKPLLMDQRVVVGVGNIYAAEALHDAGIDPRRRAARVSEQRLERLVGAVRAVLERAINDGGTTLRDFVNPSGEPGYFATALKVYGRAGAPCLKPGCGGTVVKGQLGQRSSYWCARCQR